MNENTRRTAPGRNKAAKKGSLWRRLQYSLLSSVRRERLSASAYAVLVEALYGTVVGYMSLVFAALLLTGITFFSNRTWTTGCFLLAMLAVAALRIRLMIHYRRWRRNAVGFERTSVRTIVRWEAEYAAVGVVMMMVIGATSSYIVLNNTDGADLAVAIMITIGIAGCIAGRNGSRPKIVALQVFSVCTPFVVALLVQGSRGTAIIAFLTLVFFAAAMSSTKAQYQSLRTAVANERKSRILSIAARRNATRFDTALNTMHNGLLMFDERLRVVILNDRLKTLWGRPFVEGLRGMTTAEFVEALSNTFAAPAQEMQRQIRAFDVVGDRRNASVEVTDHVNNRRYDISLAPVAGGGIVAVVDDVTEKRTQDDVIFRLAHQDSLTGIANRLALSHHIGMMVDEAEHGRAGVAMYVDLDGFKAVNDYFGHAAGDRLLKKVAQRIEAFIEADGFAARVGGDEFVVCFSSGTTEEITETAQTLIADLSRAYVINGKRVEIGASAGLARIRCLVSDPNEILRIADVALYEAKKTNRGHAVWFSEEMDLKARDYRELTVELRDAIDTGALRLHYQPTIDFRTGKIISCEALTRWTSATRGEIPPSVFIPLAEENDLIDRLGLWSLTQACKDAQHWPDPAIKIAVNLSTDQFKNNSVSTMIDRILDETGLPPSRLEIEITESVLAENVTSMKLELEQIAGTGVSIALDDFGMGYSSLSYLHNLPIQKVKLDRSFVKRLDDDPSAVMLIASIVQMTQTMRKELVIEGVETADQLLLVSQANARLIQGFYFCKPLPQDRLIAYIETAAAMQFEPTLRLGQP
ncbi:bifunctional diguanylate cyclase/phosphodiesterase [Beijerinckia sp. L45]|uniref:putative bifunctional diguanylate cyclase/phosphodiesterase n=1 Tax=Beijerinckia sp. L45 TaxID=1641855 RepID=UPI00131B6205|nr:EAL domain-containing protein [Beijerinckia sp. L45]